MNDRNRMIDRYLDKYDSKITMLRLFENVAKSNPKFSEIYKIKHIRNARDTEFIEVYEMPRHRNIEINIDMGGVRNEKEA